MEQFIAVFSEPVKPGTFEIIVPDKRMNDPWGLGRLGVITQEADSSQIMGRPSDAHLVVQMDACGRSGDSANRFIIKLSHDWTSADASSFFNKS